MLNKGGKGGFLITYVLVEFVARGIQGILLLLNVCVFGCLVVCLIIVI